MSSELKDRQYLASEVFLFETLQIAENEKWGHDFSTWALRCRVRMQLNAVRHARDVANQLKEVSHVRLELDEFVTRIETAFEEFKMVELAKKSEEIKAAAVRQINTFATDLSSLNDLYPKIAEDIENSLVREHRMMVLSDFTRWCEDAPKRADISSISRYTVGGLALSGGGIRSASFCLGVVNSLAAQKLLAGLQYVSGVSGGGYTASWLTAWAYRHKDGIRGVQSELDVTGAACAPVQWIRRYGSYLCPRPGILATDTWSLVVSYVRNWLPILVLVLLLTTGCLLLPILVAGWVGELIEQPAFEERRGTYLTSLVLVFLFLVAMRYLTIVKKEQEIPEFNPRVPWFVGIGTGVTSVCLTFLMPAVATQGALTEKISGLFPLNAAQLLLITAWIFLYLLSSTASHLIRPIRFVASRIKRLIQFALRRPVNIRRGSQHRYSARIGFFRSLACALIGGTFGGLALLWLLRFVPVGSAKPLTVFGPIAGVCAFGVAEVAIAVLMEKNQGDVDRAWASRLGGWNLGACLVWCALCALSLGSPIFSKYIGGPQASGLVALILLASTVLLAHLSKSAGKLLPAAIISFVLLMAFTALCIQPMVDNIDKTSDVIAMWLILFVIVGTTVALSTDINRFSLHAIYREGLVRTFLGSSRLSVRNTSVAPPQNLKPRPDREEQKEPAQFERRKPDPATNIDGDDDPMLEWLAPSEDRRFGYLLLNAAVNGRSAVDAEGRFPRQWPFTFSPLFCGSPASGIGYALTESFLTESESRKKLTLGTAMAVSGAAVSPASGKSTHPIRAFLLSVLNARLGLWIGNPSKSTRRKDPKLRPDAMVKDLLGVRAKFAPWIHLSDGGHFENLGLYELVRRGCRFIVAVDASCDPDGLDAELGNAIRRVRIDLGIDIRARPREVASKGTQEALARIYAPDLRPTDVLDASAGLIDPNSPAATPSAADASGPAVNNAPSGAGAATSLQGPRTMLPEPAPDKSFAVQTVLPSADGSAARPGIEDGRNKSLLEQLAASDAMDLSQGWTVFDIDYGVGLSPGRVLYLKPTVSKNDRQIPIDVRNYALSEDSFPHETTADQFFTEAQMEAYRALGEKCAHDAIVHSKRHEKQLDDFFTKVVVNQSLRKA